MAYIVRLERLDKKDFPLSYRESSILKATKKMVQITRQIANIYPSMDCAQDKNSSSADLVFYLDGKPTLMLSIEED